MGKGRGCEGRGGRVEGKGGVEVDRRVKVDGVEEVEGEEGRAWRR